MNPGEKIGKYKILAKIGMGGMGEVYLAQDAELKRKVVLKFLSDKFSRDVQLARRFRQEAQTASALNHPNIITIYEIGEYNARCFIATEYIQGKTLREILQASPVKINDAVKIAEQAAEALLAAHEAGIVHRDIKPENIMVRDKDGLVKVLDFGLAKLTEKKSEDVDDESPTQIQVNTSVGMILGTIPYMSPEQARGKGIDSRSDIWSLGVVLYEMLTGHSPFAGETTSDIIAAILKTETDSLMTLSRDFPPNLKHIIYKALEKDREHRYQNIKEFLADLKTFEKEIENSEAFGTYTSFEPTFKVVSGSEEKTQIFRPETDSGAKHYPGKAKRRGKAVIGVSAVFLVTMIAAGYWFFAIHGKTAFSNSSQIDSIAVLPFINGSDDSETEYLSDGITESLINSLSPLPNLTVKARSSVFRYKGQKVEPQKIGNELSVQAILTGRVARFGDNLSLSVELVDTQNGNQLWGETFNRKAKDIVALQSEIVREVSDKLRKRLSEADENRLTKSHIGDSETYQFYLKGRYYLNKRTPEGFEKAIQNFRQAIDREPTYALAYVGLSDCYVEMTYWSIGLPKETMPKARAAAQKALELNGNLAEAYTSIAAVAEDYDWNFVEAEQEYNRAIELNPNSADAFDRFGGFLCEQKRFDEGLLKLEKAADLDPLSLGVEMSKGACLYEAHRYDDAIEQLRKILKTDSTYLPASSLLGAIYFRKGMYEKTVEEWLKNSPLENYSPEDIAAWKKSFETSGIKGFLQKDIELRKEMAKNGRNQTLFIAMQYANLGENDQALDWLERAFEERHSWLGELQVEPTWDNLRNNPRFKDLVRRVGFPEEN